MKKNILLRDLDLPETRPLSRVRSIFSQRNGIFSTIERIRIQFPEAIIHFYHPNFAYAKIIARSENLSTVETCKEEKYTFDIVIDSLNLSPFKLLLDVDKRIEKDLELVGKSKFGSSGQCVIGDEKKLFIHKNARILPHCVFDTRDGMIVIDEGTEISPFSYLGGPLYIGKNAKVDNARITGGCIIGNRTRIGGEVENSMINDYSNKHHEGFVGHSVIGNWVNLGALTTTSDLKNNYSEVRIKVPFTFNPYQSELVKISTGTIKFGSIIGDCSKTEIGTMLNTGTVIDFGCNIFGKKPDSYSAPLSWGSNEARYEKTRFINDCRLIFARRQQTTDCCFEELVEILTGSNKI